MAKNMVSNFFRETFKLTHCSMSVVVTVLLIFFLSSCNEGQRIRDLQGDAQEGDSMTINGYEDFSTEAVNKENERRLQDAIKKIQCNEQLNYVDCIALHKEKWHNSGRAMSEKYVFYDEGHQYDLYIATDLGSGINGYKGFGYMSVVHSPKCSCQENNNQLP